MLKTIIVDDEPLARKGLVKYVNQHPKLSLTSVCENAFEAMEILQQQPIDLMLLDIEMPKLNGIDFLKTLPESPLTIIISAYPDHAVTCFELDVIDYLIKPVAPARFTKAVEKACDYHLMKMDKKPAAEKRYLFIKTNKLIEKVMFDDILYVEALHNYVAIHTNAKKIITHQNLKQVELMLPQEQFVRIQKSFIVGINHITAIAEGKIEINNAQLPISRSLKSSLLQQLLSKPV